MIVIPAIDIKNGKAVRLLYGDMKKETVYSDNPAEMAQKWVSAGARRLHVVDLDGAVEGASRNLDKVIAIKKETQSQVQLGGGIRTLADVEKILSAGIDKVILGTVVFSDLEETTKIFKAHKEKIIVGLDARDGRVAVKGWTDSSGLSVDDAFRRIQDLGGKEVVYTDISRDGALTGVNVEAVRIAKEKTGLSIIASGGVKSMDDIDQLIQIDAYGCIVGKSIYEGSLDLKAAIQRSEAHVG